MDRCIHHKQPTIRLVLTYAIYVVEMNFRLASPPTTGHQYQYTTAGKKRGKESEREGLVHRRGTDPGPRLAGREDCEIAGMLLLPATVQAWAGVVPVRWTGAHRKEGWAASSSMSGRVFRCQTQGQGPGKQEDGWVWHG
jgi:hypothetical protein